LASSFTLALDAAREAAASQHYPASTLTVVATPIGNLADISLRALCALEQMDAVACEDTRHTQHLLAAYGLKKPLIALHQHNEREAGAEVVRRLQTGQRIAYVSDAGTPGVSDPGARLVALVQAAQLRVMPIPGASSVTTLVSAMGIDTASESFDTQGFVFAGFLPAKGKLRATALASLQTTARAVILLEAPHRMITLADELTSWGARELTLGRELTKQFETIERMPCATFSAWLAADANRLRGEYVVGIHAVERVLAEDDAALDPEALRVLTVLLSALPVKTAAQLTSTLTGESKNKLYAAALTLKETA
jgi:16S rRNA (cytidine1402-2'-O)-methyltransferase